MRILFMGTPDFASASLKALIDAGYTPSAVITQPDKPKGRGYTLTPPPVKVCAAEAGIPVYQPQTLRDEAFAALLAELSPELIIVVAYGKLLPKSVLDFPKYGCVNVHGSLLPEYRGAAPIQRAIIDGKRITGVTTMYMAEGLDTGDMILKGECEITEDDNFETIHDKLAEIGGKLLVETVCKIEDGTAPRIPQTDEGTCYAAKIENSDCIIDFSRPASELSCRIRGLSPFPLAYTTHGGKRLKLVSCKSRDASSDKAPGTVIALEKGKIIVACGVGALEITSLIPEGKGRMSAADFINGRRVSLGDIFGA